MSFKQYLKENINSKPSIFNETIYRDPTDKELDEVNNSNLSSDEILNGFYYTMIGRGFLDEENKKMIVNAIKRLTERFPTNEEYKIALEEAKKLKGKFTK